MENIKTTNTNMSTLTVEKTIEQLSTAFCAIIREGLALRTIPSIMLWGPPGVGNASMSSVPNWSRDVCLNVRKPITFSLISAVTAHLFQLSKSLFISMWHRRFARAFGILNATDLSVTRLPAAIIRQFSGSLCSPTTLSSVIW